MGKGSRSGLEGSGQMRAGARLGAWGKAGVGD